MKKVKQFEEYNLSEKKITLTWNDDDNSIVFSDGEIASVDYDGEFQYRDEWFSTVDHTGADDLIRDLEKRFKRDKFEWIGESYVLEANNMRTLKGFLKELRKEYGPTPTTQSLADFIYNNYEEITGEKMGESDPASNDHIADIISYFKMDGEDFAIAWEDRTNESVVEEGKVKVFLDKIVNRMVEKGLGVHYDHRMRQEIKDKIEAAVKETMEKYDYIVEGSLNEDIFRTYNEIVGYEFNKFKEAYLELHKDNEVIYDKKDDVSYGLRKSEKEPHWKYFHGDFKLYHSEKDRDVLGLINFKKMVSKGHPWSK
jgi:hypothetical protein